MIQAEHTSFGTGKLLALDDDRVYIEFIDGSRRTISRDPAYWLNPLPSDLTELPSLDQYIIEKGIREKQAELTRKEAIRKLLTAEKKFRKLRPHYRAPLHVRNSHDPAIVSLFLAGQDDCKVLAKRCETTVKHVKEVLLDRGLIVEPIKKSKRKSGMGREPDDESQQREDGAEIWKKLTLRERLEWLKKVEPGIPGFAVRHDLGTIMENYGAEKLESSLESLVASILDDSAFSPVNEEELVWDEVL